MTTTRFAPSATGFLHLGGVANCLLNWLAARRTGGRFLVRLDGGNATPYSQKFRDSILADLCTLGMDPDAPPWSYHEHAEALTERFRAWAQTEARAYACFCDGADFERHGDTGYVERPEKYMPPTFAVEQIVGVTRDGCLVRPVQARASSYARGEFIGEPPACCGKQPVPHEWEPSNVLQANHRQWRPWSVGFQGPYDPPTLTVEFGRLNLTLEQVVVTFPNGPPQRCTLALQGGRERPALPNGHPHVRAWDMPESYNPSTVTLRLIQAQRQWRRPYVVENHCAQDPRNFSAAAKRRALDDPQRGTIRLAVHPEVDEHSDPELQTPFHPTAIYFDGACDLSWYSPLIDQELGVTDVWRGVDLIPFAHLERTAAYCLRYNPRRFYHPLLLDDYGVKFSKHAGSPRALDWGTPEGVLGHVASRLGLVPSPPPSTTRDLSASDLLAQAPLLPARV